MSKITPENVKIKDWILIGIKEAVVCKVYNTDNSNMIEVVYLDDKDRAINEHAIFGNNSWQFINKGPDGGYADNYERLAEYVSILRLGQWYSNK